METIRPVPGQRKIGGVRKSTRSNAKINNISHLEVYHATYGQMSIETHIIHNGKEVLFSQHLLNPDAALLLIKALLKMQSDVSIAVDEQLQAIVNDAVKRANEDAEAMVRCLRERTGE